MRVLWLLLLCLSLAACGGSGSTGTSGDDGKVHIPEPVPGTARLSIGTQGPAADSVLYAAQFTLRLPAGVSLPATDGRLLPDGLLVPAVSGSYAGASFLQIAVPGQVLLVNIAHPGGVTVGPLATLTCQVDAGAALTADAFTLENFSARDANGVVIPGITAKLTLQTQ
ncbi:hypothetical protein M1B72_06420 [Geomonas paludis]|uniref:Lipoprotein n=1 Tax=Geomonas paludis TaxID=2740185 RepID=A0A6V8MYD5_9BACT|nr:hypothetical protein [Geomonas paludis]UPU37335.1 hypothetical protein M1B72_06420 [Geomonas paludis]GFO65236.1 hypothetical protein GMPD_31550 [Geomonas paludis]